MATQARRLHKPTTVGGSREIPATICPDQATIAQLAYLYWLDRGCPIGSPEEDWSRAEQDLKQGHRAVA